MHRHAGSPPLCTLTQLRGRSWGSSTAHGEGFCFSTSPSCPHLWTGDTGLPFSWMFLTHREAPRLCAFALHVAASLTSAPPGSCRCRLWSSVSLLSIEQQIYRHQMGPTAVSVVLQGPVPACSRGHVLPTGALLVGHGFQLLGIGVAWNVLKPQLSRPTPGQGNQNPWGSSPRGRVLAEGHLGVTPGNPSSTPGAQPGSEPHLTPRLAHPTPGSPGTPDACVPCWP